MKFVLGFIIFILVLGVIVPSKPKVDRTDQEIAKLQPLRERSIMATSTPMSCHCVSESNPEQWVNIRVLMKGNNLYLGDQQRSPLSYIGSTEDGFDVYLERDVRISDPDGNSQNSMAFSTLVLYNKNNGVFMLKSVDLKGKQNRTYVGKLR